MNNGFSTTNGIIMKQHNRKFATCAALSLLLLAGAQARTWTSADGTKTFEGELHSFDPATGKLAVMLPTGKQMAFQQDKLSAADITFLKENGAKQPEGASAGKSTIGKLDADPKNLFKKHDAKPADMTKPVQVFILLGQSNMVGLGNIATLEEAIKSKSKYPYLVDDGGAWTQRQDVRNVFMMSGNLQHNDWLSVSNRNKLGPEHGIGHALGNAIESPVMILKSCIGNRSLGWDLLPPGSEPYPHGGATQPGYRGTPENPKGNGEKVEGAWYAGKQYDDDIEGAKKILADLNSYYPDAKQYEVAGFFFWQGEKDCGNEGHAEQYEKNLTQFIKAVRKDFDAPNGKFVMGTLGESTKDSGGNGGKVFAAQMAVGSGKGKHKEFDGSVATVYTNPMAQGGSGNGHYGGKSEVYMDVAEAMGQAMVELLKNK